MDRGLTRRFLLAGMMASVAGPLLAEAPAVSPLPRRRGDGGAERAEIVDAGTLVARAKLTGAVGFVVADAVTGQILEAHEPDLQQPPASVAKAVTALYALDVLGIGHRFSTRVLATGPVVAGRLEGDLVLAGGGDPTLDTDRLGDLAAAVAARGVTSVAGRYLVWGGALPRLPRIDAEQPAHVGYNPAVSGLNLNFNRVHFEWRRAGKGWDVTMDARAERFLPQVRMARMKIETRETPLFTYEQAAGEERWTVASAALGKGGARWMPVRLPELYAGEVFQTLLAAHGLKLPDPLVIDNLPSAEVLAEDRSDTLDVVLRDMLEFSTNLTAELVGLSASKAPSLLASSQAMTQWAARFGPGLGFVDHSGLGGASRVTAAGMVRALVAAQAGPLAGLMKDHGMRDAEGKPIKGHPVSVRAKTGTLNFASGLAGYISPPGARRLAFAIFAADPARRAALTEAEREQPEGGAVWTRRARLLQARLIDRWAGLYA